MPNSIRIKSSDPLYNIKHCSENEKLETETKLWINGFEILDYKYRAKLI